MALQWPFPKRGRALPPTVGESPLLAYFGHHKSGSTWVLQILEAVSNELGLRFLYSNGPHTFPEGSILPACRRLGVEMLCYVNADYRLVEGAKVRGVHVVRDPRDVIVSGYFSHRNSHPADDWPDLQTYREVLREVDETTGLLLEMEFSAMVMADMASWPRTVEGVVELKFEDLIADPEPAFWRILEHLGLRAHVREESLHAILAANSFEVLSRGRRPGETDAQHHYRRGVPGDWLDHFQPAHVWAFKQRYGELLLRYGYEKDHHWAGRLPTTRVG